MRRLPRKISHVRFFHAEASQKIFSREIFSRGGFPENFLTWDFFTRRLRRKKRSCTKDNLHGRSRSSPLPSKGRGESAPEAKQIYNRKGWKQRWERIKRWLTRCERRAGPQGILKIFLSLLNISILFIHLSGTTEKNYIKKSGSIYF